MSQNLLDVFTIMFESDSSKVVEGAEKGRAAAATMAEQIDQAATSAASVGKKFAEMAAGAATMLGVVSATFGTAMAAMMTTQTSLDSSEQFAASIGASAGEVAILGRVAENAGGSVEGMRKVMGLLAQDGGSLTDKMGKVAQQMEGLSRIEQEKLGSALGLEKDVINELSKGYANYAGMVTAAKATASFSPADFERAREISHLWAQIKSQMSEIPMPLQMLSVRVSGLLKEVLTWWLEIIKPSPSNGMAKAIDVIGTALENTWKFLKLFAEAGRWVIGVMADFAPVLAAAGAALALFLLPLEVLQSGALLLGIGALLLVLDDLRAYFQGEGSLFGDFLQEYPAVAAVLTTIGNAFRGVRQYVEALWETVKPFGEQLKNSLMAALPSLDGLGDKFGEMASGYVQDFIALLPKIQAFLEEHKDTIMEVVKAVGALIGMWLMYKAKSALDDATGGTTGYLLKTITTIATLIGMWKALSAAMAAVKGVVSGAIDKAVGAYDSVAGALGLGGAEKGAQAIASANSAPLSAMSSAAISNSNTTASRNTTVNVGQVTVQTQATDADGISKSMGGALDSQMTRAAEHFQDGVSH